MRRNEPVSQREYPFPHGDTLVSVTDPEGRILYANQAFVEVSGFTLPELLGQPHNMIRHPDMPEEAFRDMWETIKSGHAWTGLVKNRRKDGDHYWVRANVTPLTSSGGQVDGYMSVRTEPQRDEIQSAERLYARMREESGGGVRRLVLREGVLHNLSWSGRLARALTLGMRGRIAVAMGVMTFVGFVLGEYEAGGLSHMAANELFWGLAVTLMGAVAGAAYLRSALSEQINRLVDYANQIAGGDLSRNLVTRQGGELGRLSRALSQLNVNLLSIVRDSRVGVDNVFSGTHQIAEGNMDLSARTESQSSNLEQTAAAVEEMNASIRQSADMAEQAAGQAERANGRAQSSVQAIAALAASMTGIQDSSKRIAEIIQVVDSIAFQTNILALNAAVEAARAGEQGRGFAVVAAEVRALSQRTSTAAKEVRTLITASTESVETGRRQTEEVQAAMGDMQQSVDSVHGLISRISGTLREQHRGLDQINSAVAQLDTLTQQNAALVEEVAAAASGVNERSHDLRQAMAVFRLKEGERLAFQEAVALRKSAKRHQDAA